MKGNSCYQTSFCIHIKKRTLGTTIDTFLDHFPIWETTDGSIRDPLCFCIGIMDYQVKTDNGASEVMK